MAKNSKPGDSAAPTPTDDQAATATFDDGPVTEPGTDLAPTIDAEIISDGAGKAVTLRDQLAADIEPSEMITAKHPAMVALYSALEKRSDVATEADVAVAEIIAQVLQSDTMDEVLGDSEVIGLREMLNEPLTIFGWKAVRSDYEEGAPWYAVMDVQRHRKNWRGPVTCGAQTILAQLVRIGMLDEFPATLIATNATKKPTKAGYWPLKLSKLPPELGGSGL